jgi:hypothetical protein
MTTTTLGKAVPKGFFSDVEMESPDSVGTGEKFTVKVKFAGDPANPLWPFIRDLGDVSHKIEVVADTVGPGEDISLNGPDVAGVLLVAGQDEYEVDIEIKDSALSKLSTGLYELGAVITFTRNNTLVKGVSAFIGDALMQVR